MERGTKFLVVDPGSEKSGYVLIDFRILGKKINILEFGKVPNDEIRKIVDNKEYDYFVIEGIQSYSSKFANTIIRTTLFVGAMLERVSINNPPAIRKEFSPKTIRALVAKDAQANDSMVREAVISTFAGILDISSDEMIGTKANPGPLYGVKADVWQALGGAIAMAKYLLYEEVAIKVDELEKLEGVKYGPQNQD